MSFANPFGRPVQKSNLFGWILVIGTALFILFTSMFGFAISSPTGSLAGFVRSVVSQTLALRTITNLTKITTMFLGALFTHTLDAIMWTAASSKDGITMPILLGLSSTTELTGLLELLFKWDGWFNGPSPKYLRFLAIMMRLSLARERSECRLAFYILIYIIGVVLTCHYLSKFRAYFDRGHKSRPDLPVSIRRPRRRWDRLLRSITGVCVLLRR